MRAPLSDRLSFLYYHRTRFLIVLFNHIPNFTTYDWVRRMLLKAAGFQCGKNVIVFAPLSLSAKTYCSRIELCDNVFINAGSRFSVPGSGKLRIGRNSLIGPNVTFETLNHGIMYRDNEPRGATVGEIFLEEGVWVGGSCILLQNIHIGKGAVIAGGSVVTKSVSEHTVVGGVPAKVIKSTKSTVQ